MSADQLWLRIKRYIILLASLIMLVQIGFGLLWMVKNFDSIPGFGDTNEYVEMSASMDLDEYRPVLYPLVLRAARSIDEEHYYRYVYVLQTALSLFAMTYAVHVLGSILQSGKRGPKHTERRSSWKDRLRWLLCGLYLTTIPMITFMNFTVLTDSIANSLLVLFLTFGVDLIYGRGLSIRCCAGFAVTLILQSILRADRLYSGLLLLAIIGIIAVVRRKKHRRLIALAMAGVALISFTVTRIVSTSTQVTGSRGRVRTSLSFVLLDRVVWPNMAANYDFFPQEIKDNISLEEAQTFDSHNNQVMYFLAPMLEVRVGREKAEEYYRTMAGVVWGHDAGKVLKDIGENIGMYMISPFMHRMAVKRIYTKTNIGWNMHCMSLTMPELSRQYDLWGFCCLVALLSLALLEKIGDLAAWARRRNEQKDAQRRGAGWLLIPFIISGLIISLWFSVGDGAPPNDRYTLIVYTTFGLMAAWPVIANKGLSEGAAVSLRGE